MTPRTRRVLYGAAWLVATALVCVLLRTVDAAELWYLLRQADAAWIALALLSNLLILPSWSEQWRMLMPIARPVGMRRMLPIVAMTSLVGNTLPASGQLSAVLLLAREPGVTNAAAVSVLALDQLVEGITKVGIILLAARLLPLPHWMQHGVLVLGIVVVVSLVALVLFAHQTRWLARFASELDAVRNMRRFALAIASCTCSKCLEALAIVAVQRAFDVNVPASSAIVIVAVIVLATMVPLSPANIGTYEGGVMAVYRQLGLPAETALALAFVQHACLLVSTAGAGYLVFVFRNTVRGKTA